MIENKWQSLTKVVCSFLAKVHLPKKYWNWTLWKAKVSSNISPVSRKVDAITNPDYLTTPYYDFLLLKNKIIVFFFVLVLLAHFIVSTMGIIIVINLIYNVFGALLLVIVNLLMIFFTIWHLIASAPLLII